MPMNVRNVNIQTLEVEDSLDTKSEVSILKVKVKLVSHFYLLLRVSNTEVLSSDT